MSEKSEKMGESFLANACEIIGDKDSSLSNSKILSICNYYAVKHKLKIPITSLEQKEYQYTNKKDKLFKNLSVFNLSQQYAIIKEILNQENFFNNEKAKEFLVDLYQTYGYLDDNLTNSKIIVQAKQGLQKYQKSSELFNSAIEKYQEQRDSRNLLDDLRLCLEELLRNLNNQSLEKNTQIIGKLLKEKGISENIRTELHQELDFYCKFQNEQVKHSLSSIKDVEIQYLIEKTSFLINSLVRFLEK